MFKGLRMKKPAIIPMKTLPVIHESQEMHPRVQLKSKFSGQLPGQDNTPTTPGSSLFDSTFLERSNQSILHEYNKNPFYKAKINYLLKQHTSDGHHHCKGNEEEDMETLRSASSNSATQMNAKLAELSLMIEEMEQRA